MFALAIEISLFWCYFKSVPSAGALSARCKEDTVLSHSTDAVNTNTAARAAMNTVPSNVSSDDLLAAILAFLEEDKAEDVTKIDLRGKSEMADYMVICSGRSSRQVGSIAEKLSDKLKHDFEILSKVEGKELGDWVLIDSGDVIVHVFRPEVREFYQLEKMWQPAGAETKA
ncbi:MAG: ribosome silencing factor [Pseudoruegeria sp.]